MHVLGHDIAVAVLLARVIDGQDVRMLQHADQVRLGQEHLARDARALFVAAGVHVVDLDRDVAPVVGVVREVHHAGAATAHFLDDHVLADPLRDPRAAALGKASRSFGGCGHGRGRSGTSERIRTEPARTVTLAQSRLAHPRAPSGLRRYQLLPTVM